MESIYVIGDQDKFVTRKFEKKFPIDSEETLHIYDLAYYESGLNEIEQLFEGERMIGDIKITRKFINSEGNDPFFFSYHTNLKDSRLFEEDLKATIAIVHGFGENSDIFLESAILYALNGFDVHLVDLRGYGLTGGPRMNSLGIADYHHDVTCLL